jgi:hypothetical protein
MFIVINKIRGGTRVGEQGWAPVKYFKFLYF